MLPCEKLLSLCSLELDGILSLCPPSSLSPEWVYTLSYLFQYKAVSVFFQTETSQCFFSSFPIGEKSCSFLYAPDEVKASEFFTQSSLVTLTPSSSWCLITTSQNQKNNFLRLIPKVLTKSFSSSF